MSTRNIKILGKTFQGVDKIFVKDATDPTQTIQFTEGTGGITPTGNKTITSVNQEDVSNYATAQVDSSVQASKVAYGQTLLGLSGEFSKVNSPKVPATANDILQGKTAFVDGVEVTGNLVMPTLLDYKVTFVSEGSTYFVVSVNNGDSILAPATQPTKVGYHFVGWGANDSATTFYSFPYTVTSDVTMYAVFVPVLTATVTGLGSQLPSSVSFDVDNQFIPANLCEEVTMGGDTFIKIKTLYRKINTDVNNQITSFTMSNTQIDNTYKPYSVFVDENGNVMDYVLIGKYWNSDASNMLSRPETTPVSSAIANARTYARARGTGYQLWDWQFMKLWQDLIIMFKKTVNTNSGTAWTYDELGVFWGTKECVIDGFGKTANGEWAFSIQPSKYVNTPNSTTDGYVISSYSPGSSGIVKSLGYDSSYEFFNQCKETGSTGNYDTYYCDYTNGSVSGDCVANLKAGASTGQGGVFAVSPAATWTSNWGQRLCYRPISTT